MGSKIIKLFVLALALTAIFTSCRKPGETDGPFFGNGFHNGWADQTSIVIWTRLTNNRNANSDTVRFLAPLSKDELKELDEGADAGKIHAAQIPEGFTLDDINGGCPGAAGEVKLTCYPSGNAKDKTKTKWIAVDNNKNFTHQWKLDKLTPDTKYVVEIEARMDKKSLVSDVIKGAFRTPPSAETEEEIEFCMVTCHDFIRKDTIPGHKIYSAMMDLDPDFYVHTGDIEYYDKPYPWAMTEELMRFKWDRLFAQPLQRKFWTQVTTYFMKDDHDVLRNDAFPGKKYGTVSWNRGLEIFDKEQFPTNDKPYKTVRWGKDLQIWIVEGRNYRSKNSDPDGPEKTIFGKEQKDWLFRTMKESGATFKILISSTPILGPDRDNKKDNYSNSNWQYEGDEIRNFLNQFDNIYICNGDRHWQYVTHLSGTNLWEFSSGAGTDQHAGGWMQSNLLPEHKFLRVKGGFLRGHVSRESGSPKLTFQHCDVNGNVVHEETFVK